MSLPTLKFGILELLTCLSLGLTSSGQVGLGPYERLVEEADVIAFAEILSTDDTRMAADGPMYGDLRILKVVKGALSPAIRFGASAWVGPTYKEGELRILFLQGIRPGHGYYQDVGWASVEAGRLDLFFTRGGMDGCSEDSLSSFFRGLEEVASDPPRLELGLAQRTGGSLAVSIRFLNGTAREIWLQPSRMGFSFEANQVKRSLAVRWEDLDDSQWIALPSGSALSGEAFVSSQDVEGLSEITVTVDNRSALFPHTSWVGAQALQLSLTGASEER